VLICVIRYNDQCLAPDNVSYGTTTSVFHLALCHMIPRPVYFTWQCIMRYHDQCNLEICYTVPQPVPFTWRCVMRYHDQCNLAIYVIRYHNQCITPGNVLCGTTTSVFHLAICHTVPRPVPFTWQCVMQYHDQCSLAICHTVPQPVYFTWQCGIRYHNQCISPGNVAYGTTTSAFHLAVSCGTTTRVFHLAMCLCGTTTNVYIKSVGNISYDFLSSG
jgi:hypothetical protein